jgi:lipopolysaccharide export system permease protein
MFKIYQKYLITSFIGKFIKISFVFFSLTLILGILEEISFFKDSNVNFFYPYFLTLLNAPITLFEIFPFIFLLSTQFFLYDLFKKDELKLLKKSGLKNITIVKILFILSIVIGLFNIFIYYNAASKLKYHYSTIKNNLSNDNKYLAMVIESGLWIKDEINNNVLIIKSKYIENNFLSDIIINEFDNNFNLIRTIQSEKIDISNNDWIIINPRVTIENNTEKISGNIKLSTNFNFNKINSLYSNISSFTLIELLEIKNDFKKFGYSTDEISIHMLKILTTPLFYGIITIFSIIVMFNFTKNKTLLFHIAIGVLLSVGLYYVIFIFSSLGNNGKIPILMSIFFPLSILFLISIIGLININDK